MGRKSLEELDVKYWTEGKGLTKIEKWLSEGLFDLQIAQKIGIHRITLWDWKQRYPKFKEKFVEGRKYNCEELVNATFKSAQGYYVEEEVLDVKGEKHTLKKWIAPNSSSQIFLLKNWMKEEYRDKHDVNVQGAIPIVLSGHDELKD